jgi:hypothetical protein
MSAIASALEPGLRPVLVRLVPAAEVPPGDAWLGAHEREGVAALRFSKRRADWRLGHYTAKRAAAARLGWPPDPPALARLEVLADDTGAPRLHCDGDTPLALSLSHRAGWALAAVAPPDVSIADYLTPHEQALVAAADTWDRAHWTTLSGASRSAP